MKELWDLKDLKIEDKGTRNPWNAETPNPKNSETETPNPETLHPKILEPGARLCWCCARN